MPDEGIPLRQYLETKVDCLRDNTATTLNQHEWRWNNHGKRIEVLESTAADHVSRSELYLIVGAAMTFVGLIATVLVLVIRR